MEKPQIAPGPLNGGPCSGLGYLMGQSLLCAAGSECGARHGAIPLEGRELQADLEERSDGEPP